MSSTYIELRDVLNNLRHETSVDILRTEKGEYFKGSINILQKMLENRVLRERVWSERQQVI